MGVIDRAGSILMGRIVAALRLAGDTQHEEMPRRCLMVRRRAWRSMASMPVPVPRSGFPF